MKNTFEVLIFLIAISSDVFSAENRIYKVSIKEQASSPVYSELIKEILAEEGAQAEVVILPASRSVYMIENRLVDIQIPQLRFPGQMQKQDYAAINLFETAFVLYCNTEAQIGIKDLDRPETVTEIDPTLIEFFALKLIPTNSIESSLKKIALKRINGLIASQYTGDSYLKKSGLKNIKRIFFMNAYVTITIQKGGAGGPVDKMITDGYKKLKASGKYEKIMGNLIRNAKFSSWQP